MAKGILVASLAAPLLNVTQTYTLWKIDEHGGAKTMVMNGVPAAPWNVDLHVFDLLGVGGSHTTDWLT